MYLVSARDFKAKARELQALGRLRRVGLGFLLKKDWYLLRKAGLLRKDGQLTQRAIRALKGD